jgi:hypothetical protein
LREKDLTIADPGIKDIPGICREHLPFPCVWSLGNEFRGSAITERETGGLRIDSSSSAIASGQTHLAFFAYVDAIESVFLRA